MTRKIRETTIKVQEIKKCRSSKEPPWAVSAVCSAKVGEVTGRGSGPYLPKTLCLAKAKAIMVPSLLLSKSHASVSY